jgi:hypothetical protein
MNTAYKKRVPSPMKIDREQAFDLRGNDKHVAHELIQKHTGTYELKAVVEEDLQTLTAMKHPGLISFLCTLLKGDRVIAQGRGHSILSPNNRYLQRAVSYAFNSSLADAAYRATRVLDTFRNPEETDEASLEEAYKIKQSVDSVPATERQQDYLKQLIQENVQDEEREQLLAQLGEMSKEEASEMIATFLA